MLASRRVLVGTVGTRHQRCWDPVAKHISNRDVACTPFCEVTRQTHLESRYCLWICDWQAFSRCSASAPPCPASRHWQAPDSTKWKRFINGTEALLPPCPGSHHWQAPEHDAKCHTGVQLEGLISSCWYHQWLAPIPSQLGFKKIELSSLLTTCITAHSWNF